MSYLTVSNITDPLNTGVIFPNVAPKTVTLPQSDNSTSIATTAYVRTAITNVAAFPIVLGSTSIAGSSTTTVISGLTLNNSPVGVSNPSTGSFTTLSSTGSTALGAVTATSLTSAAATLTGGTIDGTAIGSTTASSGAFTSLVANGSVTFTGSPAVNVPTVASGNNSTLAASTAFVTTAVANGLNGSTLAASPTGLIAFFAIQNTTAAPTGWLKCNGASVLRTDFPTLFSAIGTTYGSVDSTHFTLPELRGEFIRGLDDGRGVDTGRTQGSFQAGQYPSHTHTTFINTGNGTSDASYNPHYLVVGDRGPSYSDSWTSVASGGTSNSSENRSRNVAFLACIKY